MLLFASEMQRMCLAENLTLSLFWENELESVNALSVKEGKLLEEEEGFSQLSFCQVALKLIKEAKVNLKGCIIF